MTEIILPSMGEGIIDATVTRILKNVGDNVYADEAIFEVATDKVDSEIVSPVDGVLSEIRCKEGDVLEIETIMALVSAEGSVNDNSSVNKIATLKVDKKVETEVKKEKIKEEPLEQTTQLSNGNFISPLVRSIAKEENISIQELESILGTGLNNRLTKDDIIKYIANGKKSVSPAEKAPIKPKINQITSTSDDLNEIVEMDRMRSLIANHMMDSIRTSAHVSSFVEVDMTNIVKWRDKNKELILAREKEKLSFMPVFIDAIVKAIKDFPGVNVSVEGNKIIYKKNINIGMAAALPTGNLIVPVIKNADKLSLLGLTKEVNDLANRSRINKLQATEITGGTFTITNMGTFGNITGTPIINQPQVAILAVGSIKKKPAVIETPEGDFIGIRHLMIMSMSYDHRVVDGALGGMFLKRVSDYLENFDIKTKI